MLIIPFPVCKYAAIHYKERRQPTDNRIKMKINKIKLKNKSEKMNDSRYLSF